MGSMLSLQTTTAGLALYQFGEHLIRVVTDEKGELLFVGKDVCDCLAYARSSDAIQQHCKGAAIHRPVQTAGGVQNMRVLTEADVMRLIVGSTLPAAQAFERLVFEEILPTIRRTGSYEIAAAPALPKTFAEALRLAADQQDVITAQAEQLAAAAPAVEFVGRYVESTGLMTFRQVAKLLKVKEPQFRQFLREAKVMYVLGGEWTAHAQHIEAGRFEVRAGTAQNSGHAYNTAKFTAKGVEWVAGELAKWQLKQHQDSDAV